MKLLIISASLLTLATLACSVPLGAISTSVPATVVVVEMPAYAYKEYVPTDEWLVCSEEALTVRGAPNDNATILRYLKRGDGVHVREWSRNGNGWAMIAPTEWVNGDFLCRKDE